MEPIIRRIRQIHNPFFFYRHIQENCWTLSVVHSIADRHNFGWILSLVRYWVFINFQEFNYCFSLSVKTAWYFILSFFREPPQYLLNRNTSFWASFDSQFCFNFLAYSTPELFLLFNLLSWFVRDCACPLGGKFQPFFFLHPTLVLFQHSFERGYCFNNTWLI